MEVPTQLSLGVAAYYTFALTLVGVFTTGMLLTQTYRELAYAVYGLLMLALSASMDGTIAYLIGGTNWIMTDAPLFIGAVTAGFGFAHIAVRLSRTGWTRWLRPPMFVLSAVAAALIPSYFAATTLDMPYVVLNLLLLVMVLSQALASQTGASYRLGGLRATLVLPLMLGVILILLYAVDLSGGNFSRATVDQINRALILGHLVHVLFIAAMLVIDEIRAKERAEHRAEVAKREAAEIRVALSTVQDEFESAKKLADARSRQLAAASHDIKQPIAALRQALDSDQTGERVRGAIDYLDELAASYLDGAGETEPANGDLEPVAMELIVSTVVTMFEEESKTAGVDLHAHSDAGEVSVNPLALTRAISNAVANALAHADARRIDVHARSIRDQIEIEVIDDGIGMSRRQLARATQAGVRGEQSKGSGLGLSIIGELAEAHDWDFAIESAPDEGTMIRLRVPAA